MALDTFRQFEFFEGAVSAPLAERMRPQRLDEFRGQVALVGPNAPFRRAIEDDRVHSFILWGPPGTGKTTLARIVAQHTESEFIALSAVLSGVKDIKEAISDAKDRLRTSKKRTILFVDEIHRFNKSQQDALLPFVEDGTVTLIGATTENPSFELNSALLSRAPVFILKSLEQTEISQILKRALSDATRGVAKLARAFPDHWVELIAKMANGDARRALTLLERAADFLSTLKLEVTAEAQDELLAQALGQKTFRYDSNGEEHFNTISAFIKSMRDNDPSAALYYLARMLEGGEDPLYIVRRMVIFASEDIGNADPRALEIALNVKEAVDFVGLPEARINLAQGVAYLASAPKSRACYDAIDLALNDVRELGNLEIPVHFKQRVLGTNNLPKNIEGKRYYEPKDVGLEKQIRERLTYLGRLPASK